jgi:hypothetical protein
VKYFRTKNSKLKAFFLGWRQISTTNKTAESKLERKLEKFKVHRVRRLIHKWQMVAINS